MYEVCFSDISRKQLDKLENDTRTRIIKAIERIRIRPESYVRRLVGEPYYRLRVGDYRVILDIDRGRMIVMILYVGHRRNVYKN